jgi:hypothetical protein
VEDVLVYILQVYRISDLSMEVDIWSKAPVALQVKVRRRLLSVTSSSVGSVPINKTWFKSRCTKDMRKTHRHEDMLMITKVLEEDGPYDPA